MSPTTFRLVVALEMCVAGQLYSQGGVPATYFPLHVGDTWLYNSPPPPSNPWDVRTVRDSVLIEGRTYFVWRYGDGVDIIDTVRADSVGNIRKYSHGKEYLLYGFQLAHGATYRYDLGRDFIDSIYYFNVHVTKNVTATTPAGTFSDCISLDFDIPQVVDEEVTYTFAPNIGLVVQQNDGWGSSKLTSAKINGVLVVSVNGSDDAPKQYRLHQNYPNPFNPGTTITYELANSGEVKLSVFDLLGREVSVLQNERMKAGVHEVKFDGSQLASGVYFYRMQAGAYVKTRRLLFLK